VTQARPRIQECGHLYPIVVEIIDGGKKHAKYLGCQDSGPARDEALGALRALRFVAMYRERVGA
jgi:hypothetical protein